MNESGSKQRKRLRRHERSGLQILEESFHLLRLAGVRHFWTFYVGAVPFAVGLLYFTADMSRSSREGGEPAVAALAMTGFFFWMRFCQAKFCAGLWDTISPGQASRFSAGENLRRTAALFLIHSLQVPLLLVGFFFVIPLGWIVATLQNFTVLAFTRTNGQISLRGLTKDALRFSHDEWAQNHAILLVILVVSLFTWINVLATCILVPTFGKSFFGIDSVFTLSPLVATMNSTFFLGTLLMTYLVVSPMLKAVYVLRCFYAASRDTGEDLLSRLSSCRKRRDGNTGAERTRSFSSAALLAVLLLFFSAAGGSVRAEGGAGVSEQNRSDAPALDGDRFREEAGRTLAQKKYQWRLSRRVVEETEEKEATWIARRVREVANTVRSAARKAGDWIDEVTRKLFKRKSGNRRNDPSLAPGLFDQVGMALSIGLIVIVLGLLGWLGWIFYRKYRTGARAGPRDSDSAAVDLRSEDIVATQLPENEWMRLAREQMAKGDRLLAMRAMFLATLANLGEGGLLQIRRFKSNRDYRLELERRARPFPRMQEAFEENTRLFERSWYGPHEVRAGEIETFLGNYEAIAGESERAAEKVVERNVAAAY
jgi:hypothetical protein